MRTSELEESTARRRTVTPAVLVASVVLVIVAITMAAVDPDPQRFTTIFGVVIVAAAFALPRRHRGTLVVWSWIGWAVALAVGGVRDPVAIVTQLGGAALLGLVALRTTASLELALRVERSATRASRTRATLLGSVLRLRSLEPDEVAEAVVRGVREAGFDSAVLRAVDGDDLRLVAARPAGGQDPPFRLSGGRGLVGVAARTGRPVVVHEYWAHRSAIPESGDLGGAVAVPVRVDGEIAAVLFAGRREVGLTTGQVEAVELLAEEAGTALERARGFAADAATVSELRRLDDRTHDFVSTVSHELRTPMTVIDGLGQTLERRWTDLDHVRRADLLRRIDENAERLAAMVRSLVDSSALEQGRIEPRLETVDLGACVAAVLGRLSSLLDEHPTRVDIAGDQRVEADPSLLQHVLENLLANAARHTPPGTAVLVRARPTDGDVEVEVSDEGPGIDPQDLPHVLERFYRAGEPTTRPSGGLGLGLALSQQIIEAHGRALTVTSEVGIGTRFTFRLPVTPSDPGEAVTSGT